MKKRIDEILVEKNLAKDIKQAKIFIMSGIVFCNTQLINKADQLFKGDENFIVKTKEDKYVSRGGYKLEKALEVFNVDLKDMVVIDLGSSTGGFTDCSIQNGAKKVYCVDSGTNQLSYKMRSNDKTVVMEKTSVKKIDKDLISETIDVIVCDMSFISSVEAIKCAHRLDNVKKVIVLIKPQFEAERHEVEEGGVVSSKEVHAKIIQHWNENINKLGYFIQKLTVSPIKGKKNSNIEYLAYVTQDKPTTELNTLIKEAIHG